MHTKHERAIEEKDQEIKALKAQLENDGKKYNEIINKLSEKIKLLEDEKERSLQNAQSSHSEMIATIEKKYQNMINELKEKHAGELEEQKKEDMKKQCRIRRNKWLTN